MGYGEYGGDGSVQLSNLISNPADNDCMMTPGKPAWQVAENAVPPRLSARAQALLAQVQPQQRTYIGRDLDDNGLFKVTVVFADAATLNIALAQFQAASQTAAQQAGPFSVTITLPVEPDTPGQIQIAWGEHAAATGA